MSSPKYDVPPHPDDGKWTPVQTTVLVPETTSGRRHRLIDDIMAKAKAAGVDKPMAEVIAEVKELEKFLEEVK